MHMFHDRQTAAETLADKLREYPGMKPLVLAIPSGAVPMGKVVAQRLVGGRRRLDPVGHNDDCGTPRAANQKSRPA